MASPTHAAQTFYCSDVLIVNSLELCLTDVKYLAQRQDNKFMTYTLQIGRLNLQGLFFCGAGQLLVFIGAREGNLGSDD